MLDNNEKLKLLRAPFEKHHISLKPKPKSKDAQKGWCDECKSYHGLPAVHLEFVGHAALTDRLLEVDPLWNWEPLSLDGQGLPARDKDGGMWIKLTVCGMTRLGYGDAEGKSGPNATKELIGDALRNAAMRFGCALDLWHKGILHMDTDEPENENQDAVVKHPLGEKGFKAALAAVKAKQYTVAQIEVSNSLTLTQRDELQAAELEAGK